MSHAVVHRKIYSAEDHGEAVICKIPSLDFDFDGIGNDVTIYDLDLQISREGQKSYFSWANGKINAENSHRAWTGSGIVKFRGKHRDAYIGGEMIVPYQAFGKRGNGRSIGSGRVEIEMPPSQVDSIELIEGDANFLIDD